MLRWLILALIACGGGSKPDVNAPTNKTAGTEAPPRRENNSPYNSATWTKKLDDPKQRERAVMEIEQIGDPAAIEPLGRVWVADRELRVLQVMISLARPLTPADAKARFIVDYEESGRPANWKRVAPFLLQAVREIDATAVRSVEAAAKASDALGEAQLVDAIEPLFALAGRPPSKKTFVAQIAAVRALGKLANAKAQIGPGLAKLIAVEAPRHPRTAKTKEDGRVLEEQYGMHLAITAAAINALGELHVATESKTLTLAIYRLPELATQIRRALVASGPSARDMLLEVLAGKHTAVEQLFKARKLGRYCGDTNELPDNQCQVVSLRDFYAALILGDFRDPRAVPALLEALKRPAAPAYYTDDLPGPTQYSAVFDALRKIGAPESAAPLRAMWTDRRVDLFARIGAMEAYGIVARDTTDTKELAKIAADNEADDGQRVAAASTLARLSTDKADVATFLGLARKYLDASAKQRKTADGKKVAADAADKPLAAAKQSFDDAKKQLEATIKDQNKSAADIRTATLATKAAEDAYKIAKKKHKEVTAPFRQADQAAKAYLGFARMFQTHVARIDVAIRCKNDMNCYAASLKLTKDDAAKFAVPYVKDAANWTADEKLGLLEAAIERSMIELAKRGTQASAHTDALLDAAVSDNRLIRQSILLALPRIAKVPCTQCVAKLDAAIATGAGKITLGELTIETEMLRNYFSWAGGRVP